LRKGVLKMQKKALTILLVLVIAMLLVAGCSKKESDTTLEGTWRITELVEDGEKTSFPQEVALSDLFGEDEDEDEEYGIDNDDEDEEPDTPDVMVTLQHYLQLKDGTIKFFGEISYGEKTWVFLMDEGKYTVDGNTIYITSDEEEEEDEEAEAGAEDEGEESEEVTVWTYVITGKTINISSPDEDDDDDTSGMTAVKVADSVVAEPVDPLQFLAELIAEILKNAPES
jgi:hypothetical protein